MFGIEEYYVGLIEEAKSPEEIKKILEYNFVQGKGVPQNVLDIVFDMDPTKKKSYTRWTLMQWDKSKNEIVKAIKSGKLRKMFDTFKNRAGSGLDLTNIESFDKAMEYIPDVDPILEKEGDPNSPENDFDVLYKSPEWVVAVPHTYEANRKLGVGCRWCTAGAFGDNDYYWNRYSPAGPIFVNFDKRKHEIAPKDGKEYPYTRYQFLFEWQNWAGELMDSNDDRVNFEDVDMPEDVVDFYGEQNPKYKEMIESNGGGDSEELWLNYNEDRWDRAINILNINDMLFLSLMPEQNEYRNLDVEYMLYNEEDTSDPICGKFFDKNDYFVSSTEDSSAAILKDVQDEYVYVYWAKTSYGGGYFDYEYLKEIWRDEDLVFATDYYKFVIMEKGGSSTIVSLEDLFSDDDVANVVINKQISQIAKESGIEGYHGYVCEVIFSNKSHGLFMFEGDEAIPMIRGDYPNGELFQASVENGTIHICGKRFDYKFDGNGGGNNTNLSVVDEIDDNFYIVRIGNDAKYNLYDAIQRKVLFNETFSDFQLLAGPNNEDLIVCKYNNPKDEDLSEKALYCIDYGRFLIPKTRVLGSLFNNNELGKLAETYWYSIIGDKTIIYGFDKNGFGEIGSFPSVKKAILSTTHQPFCIVSDTPDTVNVFDIINKRLVFNEKFIAYGAMTNSERGSCDLCFFQRPEQKQGNLCGIYNFVTGQLVNDNYDVSKGIPKLLTKNICKIKLKSGQNLMDLSGTLLLPHNVKEILSVTSTDPKTIPVYDDHYMWLLNPENMELLPTKDGIDLSIFPFNGTDYGNVPLFKYKNFTFKVKPEGDKMVLYVTPPQGVGYNKEIENEIRSLIFKQESQIKENFNKVFNMINNFYNNND